MPDALGVGIASAAKLLVWHQWFLLMTSTGLTATSLRVHGWKKFGVGCYCVLTTAKFYPAMYALVNVMQSFQKVASASIEGVNAITSQSHTYELPQACGAGF